ncbi:MAG: type B 50S ribosomal protein L31 [Chlamydiales bacterium]
MKKNTHPPYQEVLFVDSSADYKFVCGSTLQPDQTEVFEGKEYPVCYVNVSSASHPFFVGSEKFVDSEGRVDKFMKRWAKPQKESGAEEKAPVEKKEAKVKRKKKK